MPAMKTVTYGVMHFVVAVTVAFAVTGSWVAAIGVGVIEPLIQTVAYTLHEKAWARRPRAGRKSGSRFFADPARP